MITAAFGWRQAAFGVPLLALLILGVCVRFGDLHSDPPAGLSTSAGLYFDGISIAHGSRSYVLFGEFRPDEWDTYLYSPTYSLLQIPWFKCFGTKLKSINAFAAMWSAISMFLGVLLFRKMGRTAMLLAALFFSIEFVLVQLGRVGLVENLVVPCMLVAALSFQAKKHINFGCGVAGFFAMAAFATKAIVPYFPIAILIGIIFRAWQDGERQKGTFTTILLRTSCYIAGFTLALLPWLLLFRLPNQEAIEAFGGQWVRSTMPTSITDALSTAANTYIFFNLGKVQNLWILAIATTAYVAGKFLRKPRELDPLVVVLTAWVIGGGFFISILKATPIRYVYTLLPAVYGLIVYGLVEILKRKTYSFSPKLNIVFADIAAIFGLTIVLRYFVSYRIPISKLLTGCLPKMWEMLLVCFMIAIIAWVIFRITFHLLKASTITIPYWIRVVLVIGVAIHFGEHNKQALKHWWGARQHTLVEASRLLGANYPDMVIGGTAACAAVVENEATAVRVCKPKWCNYEKPIEHFGITHAFISDYAGEAPRWNRIYPESMTNAVYREMVVVCGYPFKIYEMPKR